MSGWGKITRRLYEAGKPLPARKVDDFCGTYNGLFSALKTARSLGMVENVVPGSGRNKLGSWAITQRGIDWAEGRIEVCCPWWDRGLTKARRPVATWLMAMPPPNQIRLQGPQC